MTDRPFYSSDQVGGVLVRVGVGVSIREWQFQGMAKRTLCFRLVEGRVLGVVDHYNEFAPQTCKTLWKALEHSAHAEAFHAVAAGPEIMIGVLPEAQTFDPRAAPPKNQSCFFAAAECLWFYQAPHALYGFG